MGGAIGAFILVANLEWYGIFLLIPHIINFIMDTWTIAIRRIPDVKYGSVRDDGTVMAPPTMKYKSLKFWIVSKFRLTENQAVHWLYVPTVLFGLAGLFLF
ncbi:hypothetical protein D6764_04220 [Candidatus Woesearchaeota archaeon]|nr:MAG: hypothetical protein D6764_04220 [Candidatus Woesearchaeota archaeon]